MVYFAVWPASAFAPPSRSEIAAAHSFTAALTLLPQLALGAHRPAWSSLSRRSPRRHGREWPRRCRRRLAGIPHYRPSSHCAARAATPPSARQSCRWCFSVNRVRPCAAMTRAISGSGSQARMALPVAVACAALALPVSSAPTPHRQAGFQHGERHQRMSLASPPDARSRRSHPLELLQLGHGDIDEIELLQPAIGQLGDAPPRK